VNIGLIEIESECGHESLPLYCCCNLHDWGARVDEKKPNSQERFCTGKGKLNLVTAIEIEFFREMYFS
jgi:hypothetical protein